MRKSEVLETLGRGRIVEIREEEWQAISGGFKAVESHETGHAGKLLIVQAGDAFAAVESPASGKRVLRPLADQFAVRSFVTDRLDTYERMWNGCGCKIDYYGK